MKIKLSAGNVKDVGKNCFFDNYWTVPCSAFISRKCVDHFIHGTVRPNWLACRTVGLSLVKNKESSSILDQFYSELLMDVIVSSSANLDVSNFEMKSQVFIVVAICSKYILVSCQAGKRTSKEVVESRTTQRAILKFEPSSVTILNIFYPF